MPHHRKVQLAAEDLGSSGAGRVLAVWVVGATYAVEHMTDGFVPRNVLLDRRFDRKPTEVIEAMVAVNLLRQVEGGYRFHDFGDYNPSGEELEEIKRKRAEAGRLGGLRSGESRRKHGDSNGEANNEASAKANTKQVLPFPASKPEPNSKPLALTQYPDLEKQEKQRALRRRLPYQHVSHVRSNLYAAVHALIRSGPPYVTVDGSPNTGELYHELQTICRLLRAEWQGRELQAILDGAVGQFERSRKVIRYQEGFERREWRALRKAGRR